MNDSKKEITKIEETRIEMMKQCTYNIIYIEVRQARKEKETKRREHITDEHSIVSKWPFS
jgi:hypothetical protein